MRRSKFIVTVAVLLSLGAWLWRWWWPEHRYDPQIKAAAQRYGVDPALVKAVVWRESRFDPDARGTKGELGLMQLRDLAAQEWADAEKVPGFTHTDVLNPKLNTLAGTWYLRKLLRRYPATDNPVPYALADYNAGRGNVLKWMKGAATTNSEAFLAAMDFPTTKHYIATVTERREYYRAQFPRSDTTWP